MKTLVSFCQGRYAWWCAAAVLAALYGVRLGADSIGALFGVFWDDEGGYILSAKNLVLFGQAHFFEAVLVSDTAQWRGGEANGSETTIVSIGLTWPASQPDGAPTPAQQRSRLTVRTCLPQ